MSSPLISTKLYLPSLGPGLVPRSRLIARLESGIEGKLALVSAPAGSGKTTMVASWARHLLDHSHADTGKDASRSIAWVSLDSTDSDPSRFMRYLVAALRRIAPGMSAHIPALLETTTTIHIQSFAAALVNELAANPTRGMLILDDYHTITSMEVHEAVAFMLDHMPPDFHLVIITREDPPLPLARLRARGQLSELRTADLRFTTEEASQFLRTSMGLALSTVEIEAIERRTEGWIAGLQLAALSMRDHADIEDFISAFTGTHRYIADYLVEEVLKSQPGSVQSFLLYTSVLGRLCAPLCNAVLSGEMLPEQSVPDSQAMLEQLERSNLFLTHLDSDRVWYRYHQLFSDLLLSRLNSIDPDLVLRLRGRAARWLAGNGLTAEAIEQALAARDFVYAARLISHSWGNVTQQPYALHALRQWLEMLPDDVIRSDAQLCLDYAWIMASTGRLETSEQYAALAEQLVEREVGTPDQNEIYDEESLPLSRHIERELAVLLTYIASARYDIETTVKFAGRAMELLPPGRLSSRAAVMIYVGAANAAAGRLQDAIRAYESAEELARSARNSMAAALAMHGAAAVRILSGDLHEAARTYSHALQLPDVHFLPVVGVPHIGLGQVLAEWDRLEEATEHLERGIALLLPIKDWNTNLVDGYVGLARVLTARGDMVGAARAVRQATEVAAASGRTRISKPAEWLAVIHQVRTGDYEAAQAWAEQTDSDDPRLPPHQREIESIVLARVNIATGNLDEALRLLTAARAEAAKAGHDGKLVEILVLEAVALYKKGDRREAIRALGQALVIAERGGYIRIFLDEGAPIRALLRELVRKEAGASYVTRILTHFDPSPPHAGSSAGKAGGWLDPVVEPLSDREVDVLRLLVSGLSGPEIASVLMVGTSTVKTHLKNIYSKLGVHNRIQAIDRARRSLLI